MGYKAVLAVFLFSEEADISRFRLNYLSLYTPSPHELASWEISKK